MKRRKTKDEGRKIPHAGEMLWVGDGEEYVVPGDHPFLRGGALPRAAVIELLAQAAARERGRALAADGETVGQGLLVGLKEMRFPGDCRAGDRVRWELTTVAAYGALWRVMARAMVDGRVIAEGEMTFHVLSE